MNTREWTAIGVIVALLSAVGCKGLHLDYVEVPTDDVALVDYEGELEAERIEGLSENELVQKRSAEGYRLVGRAHFTVSHNQSSLGAIVNKGREIKAGKVDYMIRFDATVPGAPLAGLPDDHTSIGSVWDQTGPATMNDTQATNASEPYGFGQDYDEYRVFYFKKLR